MSDIVKRMRWHVESRGGPSRDADDNPVLPNGAWAMMLEGAARIEALETALRPFALGRARLPRPSHRRRARAELEDK